MNRGMGMRGSRGNYNPQQRGNFQQRGNMNMNMNPNMRGAPQQMMNPNIRGGPQGGMPQMMNPRMQGDMGMQQQMMNPNMRGGMQMAPNQMQVSNVSKQKMAYTSQARNMEPRIREMPGTGIDLQKLAAMNHQEQKQTLGEAIYPMVHEKTPVMAGKITGMLLEMDNNELLELLGSPDYLDKKVQEAVTVLQYHEKQQGGNE